MPDKQSLGAVALLAAALAGGPCSYTFADAALLHEAEQEAAEGRVRPLASRSTTDSLSIDFLLASQPTEPVVRLAVAVPQGEITSGSATIFFPDFAAQPARQVEVAASELGYVRGYRVAQLSVPWLSGERGALPTSATVQVRFIPRDTTGDEGRNRPWQQAEGSGPVYTALERLVANPQDLQKYMPLAPEVIPTDAPDFGWSPVQDRAKELLKLEVAQDGVYRVTGADLQEAGVALNELQPTALHLLRDGEAQPLRYEPIEPGKSSGSVSPDDNFVFYGLQNNSTFSTTSTYWLAVDPDRQPVRIPVSTQQPAAREPAVPAPPYTEKLVLEEDVPPVLTKNDQFLTILGYRWVWWTWNRTGRGQVPNPVVYTEPQEVAFDLPGLAEADPQPIKARSIFYSHIWPQGHGQVKVQVRFNEAEPMVLQLNGPSDDRKEVYIAPGILKPAGNVARFQLLDEEATTTPAASRGPALELAFDRLEIEYPRIFQLPADGIINFAAEVPEVPAGVTSPTMPLARNLEYTIPGIPVAARVLALDVTVSTQPVVLETVRSGTDVKLKVKDQGLARRQFVLAPVNRIPRVTLTPYDAKVDLRSTSHAADYLVIAHPLFMETLQPFLQEKRQAGHQVELVNIFDIYDQFSGGEQSPFAIKRFLRYAATYWKGTEKGPAASYVLLVGDSTSAYRNEFKNSVINYVPSMTVTSGVDRFASDMWFATFYGTDLLADALIGRLSVNNVEDLRVVLEKQRTYRNTPSGGPWRNTLGFVADHTEFEKSIERVMAETVPPRFFLKRIMLSEQPWIDNYYFPVEIAEAKKSKVSPATTALIRDLFNEGVAMITYFGHGSPNVWSNERIWFGGDSENSDNLMLTNKDRLPFIINMTCNSGAIDYPMPRWNICISEDFMRTQGGGAVACYVPSGPGITSQHERFTLQLNRAVLQERMKPVGAALALANWRYLLEANPPDLVKMFILLGDPALELVLPLPADPSPRNVASEITVPAELTAPGNPLYYQYTEDVRTSYAVSSIQPLAGQSLPAPADPLTSGAIAAVTTIPDRGPGGQSAALVANAAGARLFMLGHERVPQSGLANPAEPSLLLLKLENRGRIPLKAATVQLLDAEVSEPFDLLPGQLKQIPVRVNVAPGLNALDVQVKGQDGVTLPVHGSSRVIIPATAPGAMAAFDNHSVEIDHVMQGADLMVQVRGALYNLQASPLTTGTAALLRADGSVATTASLPQLEPGGATQVTLSAEVDRETNSARCQLAAQQDGSVIASHPIDVGRHHIPNLTIRPGDVSAHPESPSDGETVFFNVTVRNTGQGDAQNVTVNGTVTTAGLAMESRVGENRETKTVPAGGSATFRLRWDPFRNAGHRDVVFTASQPGVDLDPYDNSTSYSLHVRTKAKIRPTAINIMPLSAEDREKRQIRFVATVANEGETDAQGIKVVFYPTPQPKDPIGDAIIEVLPAGTKRDATLVYPLKPGEETRPFAPSIEAMLKGSLQRVPLGVQP